MELPNASRAALALVALIVAVGGGCGSAPPAATQVTSTSAAQTLECETQAFPCAFSDVPEEVRAETERLVVEAISRISDGAANDEVVAWLESESSVAEAEADADAIRFRPEGGRGVWITRPQVSAAASAGPVFAAFAHAGAWDHSVPPSNTNNSVTGAGRSERRAVVLSPYRWDFGETDDGQAVADRLRQMPEYASGVTYAENAAVTGTDVTVDDFRGWQGLQVVHVVSHGARLCKDGKCRAVVAANALPGATANIWPSAVRGVELGVEIRPEEPPRFHSLLGADFFRHQYPGGLDDTVVFLNGCSTFGPGATDLADTIRGQSSVVLGWSRPVLSDVAYGAAVALYDELAGAGRTVADGLNELGGLVNDVRETANGDAVFSTLTSTGRVDRGDLRIRDVVDIQAAAGGGSMAEGAEVQLVGEPDDGVADAVDWHLRVDGIGAQAAASSNVHVTVDGHAAAPVAVSSGTAVGTDSWQLNGTLDLGIDVSTPHQAQFAATLDLPEGGQSVDAVAAVLVGASEPTPGVPTMGRVWSGHATDRFEVKPGIWYEAEADLVFTLDPSTAQYRYLIYDLTGGTMTFSVHGTTPEGCTNTLSPVEVPITSEVASSRHFRIDTGSSPPTIDGSVHIQGPIVEVMQTCTGEYAYLTGPYSTRAQGIFIHVFAGEEPAVPVLDNRATGKSLYGDRTFDLSRTE